MKKIKYLLFILFMFMGINSVKAVCFKCFDNSGRTFFQNYKDRENCQASTAYSDSNGFCVIPKDMNEISVQCIYTGSTWNDYGNSEKIGDLDNKAIVNYDGTTNKVEIYYYDEYEQDYITIDISLIANYFFDGDQFKCKDFIIHSSNPNEFDSHLSVINNDTGTVKTANSVSLLYYTKYYIRDELYVCDDLNDSDASKNYVDPLVCKTFVPNTAQVFMPSSVDLCIDGNGDMFYKYNGSTIKIENYSGTSGTFPESICLEKKNADASPKYSLKCNGEGYYKSSYIEQIKSEPYKCYLYNGTYIWSTTCPGTNCVVVEATSSAYCLNFNEKPTQNPEPEYKEPHISTNNGCAILTPSMIDALNYALNIIKYGGTILAVLLGMLDFFKATVSDDDGATKKASTRFIKRLIAAALIFILPALIQFLLTSVKIPGVNADSVTCGVGIEESI